MTADLYGSGIRPIIDQYLTDKAKERRDYGEYFSASSAGYCMRRVIFDRLQLPFTQDDPRKQRVFESGHIFHEWIQRQTKEAGLSIAQELELLDDELKVKGHVDDLILLNDRLILYDYKTAHSRSFTYSKDRAISHYHRMQVGTYMYIIRKKPETKNILEDALTSDGWIRWSGRDVREARIMSISKDDLRMAEKQVMWSEALSSEVKAYWNELNRLWSARKLPPCTCHLNDGGYMASERYNPYFYQGFPCSFEWFSKQYQGDDTWNLI